MPPEDQQEDTFQVVVGMLRVEAGKLLLGVDRHLPVEGNLHILAVAVEDIHHLEVADHPGVDIHYNRMTSLHKFQSYNCQSNDPTRQEN